MNRRRQRIDRQQPAALRQGYLVGIAVVLVVVLAVFAGYEIRESRRIIRSAMEEGAASLVEAVARAGENALRADAEVESVVVERLLDNARAACFLDKALSDTLLTRIAIANNLHRISAFGADGQRLFSSAHAAEDGQGELRAPQAVLRGEQQEAVQFGERGQWVAAAVRRPGGGAIAVEIDAAQLLVFRRAAGVGRLIQELGENPGVVYVALQDTLGILSASQGVEQLSRIVGDSFLEEALAGDQALTRLKDFAGQQVFETAMAFAVEDEPGRLLRIGLSAVALEAEESRVKWRLGLLAGLLVVLGVAGVGWVTVRQNYALLDEAYEGIQTYSARILEQMADAVVATDPQGHIRVFNQAAERLFKLSAKEAMGQTCAEILGGEVSALEQTLKTGMEMQGQTCHYRIRQGPEVTLSVSTSLIRDGQGQVETAVAVIQDLTEKVSLEADLRRQDRLAAMGELAAGVAHEVRNPLNGIGLIVQRLELEFEPTRDREEYLNFTGTVKREVERVNRIIQQFLHFARPPELVLREADLEGVLEEAIQVMAPQIAAQGLQLERVFAGVGSLRIDAEQIKQAVLNLLNNAVEATSQGQIRVATRLSAQWVEVEVQDTGAGIPPERLERIFDLYFTTKREGTGLGLGLVHRIAVEHGGRVEVHSEVGKGTTFKLLLPKGE